MRDNRSGGGPPAKHPRAVHVAALKRADVVVKRQRIKEQRIKQAQDLKQQRVEKARNQRELQKYGFVGASERSNARRQQAQQARSAWRATQTHQASVSSPSAGAVAHAQLHGFNPGTPGPYATIQDKQRAAIEKQFHAPQTLGELGTQATQIATGINPRHPLNQGPYWLAGNLGMALLPIGRVGRIGARILRVGRAAEKVAPVVKETRTVNRARTMEEATARLAELDKQHEKIVGGIASRMKQEMGGKFDPGETGRRNLAKGALKGGRGKRAQSRAKLQAEGGKIPTQNEELRAAAEARLHEVLQRNPEQAQRYANLQNERDALRHAIQERILPTGEPSARPPTLGVVSEEAAKGMSPEVRTSANKVIAGLSFGSSKKLYAEQEALRSAERAKRAGAAEQAMQANPGIEGFGAAKHELKGALPRVEFQALKDKFGQKEIDDLFSHITNHPDLRTYDKVNAHAALVDALSGKVPTPAQRVILNKVFGREFTKAAIQGAPMMARIKNAGLEVANIPRSVLASADVSAPFRQGLVAGARHPGMFAKTFPKMLKQFGSERVHQETMQLIHEHPLYQDAMDHGLELTELGALGRREEQFMSNYAEHLPGAGRVVRASGRAYVGFLDQMRIGMYEHHLGAAQKFYDGPLSVEQKQGLTNFINSATGRGDLGRFQNAAVHLNTLFFSPRLLASRINLLNPAYYAKLDPYSRRQALRSMTNLVAFVTAVLTTAKLAGANVGLDPRSADWAKIRIGNTRIDLLGGFQQPVRLVAQLATGKVISSTTGDPMALGPGFGQMNRQDILKRFFESKLAPTPSVINEVALKGTDFAGNPISWQNELYSHTVPLAIQDARSLYQDRKNPLATLAGFAGSATGFGVQTYGPRDATKKTSATYQTFNQQLGDALRKVNATLSPEMKASLQLRQERAAQSAKAGKSSADHFAADVTLLVQHGAMPSKQGKEMIQWARGLPDNKLNQQLISNARSYLTRHYFDPGGQLSSMVKALREHGSPDLALP